MAAEAPLSLVKRVAVEVGGRFRFAAAFLDEAPPRPRHSLLALHGAPGSHNDFKYFRAPCSLGSVRLLGLNFPGYALTPLDGQTDFAMRNAHMAAFVHAFMDKVQPRVDILMAHSAGAYSALRVLAKEPSRARLLLLINPGGVSAHRAIRPLAGPRLKVWLWSFPALRPLLRPLIFLLFKYVLGIRIDSAEAGVASTQTVAGLDFDEQRRFAAALAQAKDTRVLILYGGSDPLMETGNSEELAASLGCAPTLVHESDAGTLSALAASLAAGHRRHALRLPHDGHFAQKGRAQLALDMAQA